MFENSKFTLKKGAAPSCSYSSIVQERIIIYKQLLAAISARFGDATARFGDATARFGDEITS